MERRNFLKLSALSGAVATLDSCGSPDHQLIRFIPEEDLVPGVATWKPSICTLCAAGCGMLVRVMEGDAEVTRNGKRGLMQMGLAKKLEGNPQHPVNRGKLCARGQAGLQALYHPDRIAGPLKRSGDKGSGQFQPVTWDAAMQELAGKLSESRAANDTAWLAFVTRPLRGQRRELAERFLKGMGAAFPIAYEALGEDDVLRYANQQSFGHYALPTLRLGHADYLIAFGADFLGTWNSPVAQSVAYGEMRRGRPGRRGKFVMVEPRMSQTGANADEWIACRPGMEGVLALGIAHALLRQKSPGRETNTRAGMLIDGWSAGLPAYAPEAVEKQTGVSAAVIARLAREITERGRGAAIIGGAPLAHSNGAFNALAVNALESLIDTGSGPAVLSFPAAPPLEKSLLAPQATERGSDRSVEKVLLGDASHAPKVLLINGVNPVFSSPAGAQLREAMLKIPYVVNFGSFLDESSALADLILPDHDPLESWLDDVPESGATVPVASLAAPAVRPLHDTRAMPDVLLDLAQRMGGSTAAALPWKTFDAMLQATFAPLRTHPGSPNTKTDDEFWSTAQEQGGWWGAESSVASPFAAPLAVAATSRAVRAEEPKFDGDPATFPFFFLPYASQSFGDGSLAHLPWLQELPDVMTTAMWSSWVEVNPRTADRLKIAQGDLVEIASQHGTVRAPAILAPGIAPDVVAMPLGQGHQNYGRYASGRGANAYAILAPVAESQTGAPAWAATRVKITRVGGIEESKLILYAGGMSRFPEEPEHR